MDLENIPHQCPCQRPAVARGDGAPTRRVIHRNRYPVQVTFFHAGLDCWWAPMAGRPFRFMWTHRPLLKSSVGA